MDTKLHTRRLTLLRPVPADLDDVFRLLSDRRNLPADQPGAVFWREEAEGLFQRWDRQWEEHGAGCYSVRLRGRDLTVGIAGITHIRWAGRAVLQLHCLLDHRARGRGYGREAAAAVVGQANEYFELPPVLARVRPEEAAAAHLLRRLGFVPDPARGGAGTGGCEDRYVLNWDRQL